MWDIPEAFWEWFEQIKKETGYATIEWAGQAINIVRTRTLINDKREIEKIAFGKLVCDSRGNFLERTYKPTYDPDTDTIKVIT